MDMLYTRQRWIGYIAYGMIWFNKENTELCRALWEAYLDALEPERPHTGFSSEASFVAYVAHTLTAQGWHCRREVRTPYGRIDLWAERSPDLWIIEAKLLMNAQAMTCVVGQLLCGREAYPDARLWFATPATIQPRWNSLLTRYAIGILEGPWTKHEK